MRIIMMACVWIWSLVLTLKGVRIRFLWVSTTSTRAGLKHSPAWFSPLPYSGQGRWTQIWSEDVITVLHTAHQEACCFQEKQKCFGWICVCLWSTYPLPRRWFLSENRLQLKQTATRWMKVTLTYISLSNAVICIFNKIQFCCGWCTDFIMSDKNRIF